MIRKLNRPLVLIGFMGSGKSSVGRELSSLLNQPCLELDDAILSRSGHTDISQIFNEIGETGFRSLESSVIAELPNDIELLATGGGSLLDPGNVRHLNNLSAFYVYLKTSFDVIRQRLKGCTDRPLFKDIDNAFKLYRERLAIYEKLANKVVVTDNLTPQEVALEIIDR